MKETTNQISGRWWFNGHDKPALQGVLEIAEGGSRLKLEVPDDPANPSIAGDLLEVGTYAWPKVIHGQDRHGKPVTLFGCGRPGWTRYAGAISYDVPVLAALREQAIDSWSQPFFQTAIIELEYLNRWLDQPYVTRVESPGSDQALRAADGFEVVFDLGQGVRIAFEQSTRSRSSWDEESFKPVAQIAFYFSTPRSVQEVMGDWVPWAQRLIGLLVGTGIGRERVQFFTHDISQKGLPLTQWVGTSAELLGQRIRSRKTLISDPHPHDMLASYPRIKDSMPTIVREWHRLNQEMAPVLNLFTAVSLYHSLYASAQFLFLVQALEVYHALSGRFPSPKKGKKPWAARLKELFEAHRDVAEPMIGGIAEMAERIANTRNELTHGGKKHPPAKLLSESEMSRVACSLEAFLWIVLLRELGLDGEPVKRLLNRVKSTEFVSLRD